MCPLKRFAGPARLRSGAERANGWERSFLKEGSCFKMKTRGKGMKLHGKQEQNNTQKGFEEDLGYSIKLQIILQCQL